MQSSWPECYIPSLLKSSNKKRPQFKPLFTEIYQEAMSDSLMNHSYELNLFNESIDPVYKTSLNYVLTWTDPVLKLNSVAASKIIMYPRNYSKE